MRTLLLVSILAAAAPAETNKKATPATQTAVQTVVATRQPLNEEETQELKQRDEKPDEKVAGGALSNEHLTYIVIALAAAVLVLVLK
jgi:hypothetical protein